jgi:hypothetical protein
MDLSTILIPPKPSYNKPIMDNKTYEVMLTGGHPNSLGNTIEVVSDIFEHPEKLGELLACYESTNETVRLRTSNAIKRITKEHPEWLVPHINYLLESVSKIDQASTKWTLANLFEMLEKFMTEKQKSQAIEILKSNLATHPDWIVLKNMSQTLGEWAKKDADLKKWLLPHLQRLSQDERRTVSGAAKKYLKALV